MVWKLSLDVIVLKRYVGDGYFIWRTCTYITLNMAESNKQKFERYQKKCLLSLDFDEIWEILLKEETIESVVQDATMKVIFCNDLFNLAPHKSRYPRNLA